MDSICDKNGYQLLRVGRRNEPGRVYLLTTVSFRRQPLFSDWRCAQAAAAQVASPSSWPSAELLCWVLMPDHWHGLVRLLEGGELSATMRQAKGTMARAVNRARGRGGLVWEPGYYDRALRREQDVLPAARYIIGNPIRAGLVRRAGSYPYWDACWLPDHDSGSRRG